MARLIPSRQKEIHVKAQERKQRLERQEVLVEFESDP